MDKKHKESYLQLKANISFYRRKRGLSQEQLAEQAGISRTHISNVEAPNGKSAPSVDVLFSIADALDIPIVKLFDFRD